MCSEVKGLRSAMSIPADLLLSGALAQPASTIVQPNCFEDPISSPTGASVVDDVDVDVDDETFRTSPAARGGSETKETQLDIQIIGLTLREFG